MFSKYIEKETCTTYPLCNVSLCFVKPYLTRLWSGTDLAMKSVGDYEVTSGEEGS